MNKISFFTILLGGLCCCLTASASQPAPTTIGVGEDGPEVAQNDAETDAPQPGLAEKPDASAIADTPDAASLLQKQIADLEAEIIALRTTLEKMGDSQKEVEQLRGKVTILEGDNSAFSDRVKTLETDNDALARRLKLLEAENANLQEGLLELSDRMVNLDADTRQQQQRAAKPAFVQAAVRFHNHEGRPLRMNVNGVWHTLKEGENDIWVPHGPVHIYRYTGAEPKLFWDWKPYQNGYIMEFDVGTP